MQCTTVALQVMAAIGLRGTELHGEEHHCSSAHGKVQHSPSWTPHSSGAHKRHINMARLHYSFGNMNAEILILLLHRGAVHTYVSLDPKSVVRQTLFGRLHQPVTAQSSSTISKDSTNRIPPMPLIQARFPSILAESLQSSSPFLALLSLTGSSGPNSPGPCCSPAGSWPACRTAPRPPPCARR